MTIVVTSSNDNTIAIPAWLMKALNLHDGTAVKATIDGQTLEDGTVTVRDRDTTEQIRIQAESLRGWLGERV